MSFRAVVDVISFYKEHLFLVVDRRLYCYSNLNEPAEEYDINVQALEVWNDKLIVATEQRIKLLSCKNPGIIGKYSLMFGDAIQPFVIDTNTAPGRRQHFLNRNRIRRSKRNSNTLIQS